MAEHVNVWALSAGTTVRLIFSQRPTHREVQIMRQCVDLLLQATEPDFDPSIPDALALAEAARKSAALSAEERVANNSDGSDPGGPLGGTPR